MVMGDEQIAEVCYQALGVLLGGNPACALPWDCLPGGRREVLAESVRLARLGLRPEQFHDERVKRYVDLGWVYGPVWDDAGLVSPAICTWEDLDGNTRSVVRVLYLLIVALATEDFTP